MRVMILMIFLMPFSASFCQKITYNVPDGFERDISKEDYKKIVDASASAISKRYTIDFVKNGTIQLAAGQEMQAFNLDNLILKCLDIDDKSKWKEVIQSHFDSIFSSIDEQKKIDPQNYETIKNYLSIRIYPSEMLKQMGDISSLITRTDLEGTHTLLMLDLPGAFTPVQKDMFDLWKQDTLEVFRVALTNINKQPIEKVTKNFAFDQTNIEIIFLGNEDYAASYALDLLNNSPDLLGEWGSVIVLPNKGFVAMCKITKDKPVDFVKFIQMTKATMEKSFREHPQRISPQYFWYFNGAFTTINVLTDKDGNINVISPMGLADLMTEKK